MNRAIANTTGEVNFVFWFITGICLFFLVLVTGLMVYFAVKYHRSRHPQPVATRESAALEIAWTLIPTLLVLAMFWYGYEAFRVMRDVPANALVVNVTGMMWKWEFAYPNNKKTEVLYVPVNQPVRLNLKSADVIHGFYIPAFRVKEDVVPGKLNYLWFKPQNIGAADIFCSQFCGLNHAYMMTWVNVMAQPDFDAWYTSTNATPTGVVNVVSQEGLRLLDAKGCLICHRLDDSRATGPGLRGIFGRPTTVVADGKEKTLTADEAYLRRALQQPSAEIVKGYVDVMPPPPNLTDADLEKLVQVLKELK